MKKNELDLIQVLVVSKRLLEEYLGESCKTITVPVELLDENNKLKEYTSHCICLEGEEEKAKAIIQTLSGLTKEEFIKNNPYCHITTYPTDDKKSFTISLDKDDNNPHKLEMNDGYEYIELFLYRFNNMRNNLIDKNEIVKPDDIFQYLDLVVNKEKYNKKENLFQKLKKRFK